VRKHLNRGRCRLLLDDGTVVCGVILATFVSSAASVLFAASVSSVSSVSSAASAASAASEASEASEASVVTLLGGGADAHFH